MRNLGFVLYILAVVGTVTSSIFLGLVFAAVSRFRRRLPKKLQAVVAVPDAALPFVSVMKPLHGVEPRLRETLRSFFQQDYPHYELIFGARNGEDPALAIVSDLQREFPHVPATVVYSGPPQWPNAKVFSLDKMLASAKSDYVIISDSDVFVHPDYLRNVTVPLLDPKTGLVTCVYRGVPVGGSWAVLEGLGMSVDMTSGVLLADMFEGMKFALGPTMATRKDALARIGGIGATADFYSDDFELGRMIADAGYHVELSHHVIEHMVVDTDFGPSLDHQLRWMKSTRFSRPVGHVGSGLTFAVPFGILGLVGAAMMGTFEAGVLLFGWSLLNRVLQCVTVGWSVVRDRRALALCWLYPARDLFGFMLWVLSFTGGHFDWRGEKYQFQKGGRIISYRS
jgi:ceramide glucosyltransferase